MTISPNRIRALRLGLFVLFAVIAVIAIIDASLAVVLVIMGVGLLVLIVPPLVIRQDEHESTGRVQHPSAR
jgi:hypothetical protein